MAVNAISVEDDVVEGQAAGSGPVAGGDDRGVRIEGVRKTYGSVVAVEDLSMSLDLGEIICLLGPSGAGKSTLLNLMTGLIQPDVGQIFFGGRDVTYEPPERRNVGAVFQSFALFPHMTVFDNVAFGLRCQKRPKEEIERLVPEHLEAVGLGDKGDRKPHELSGGERQRVAFARALITKPAVLALDEPFGSLDVQLRGTLRAAVRQLVRQSNVPAILITHDRDDAFGVADRVGIIRKGRLLQLGTLREVYDRPRNAFIARFLGEANLVVLEDGKLRTASARDASFMIRPEHLRIVPASEAEFTAEYRGTRYAGHLVRHYVDHHGTRLQAHALEGSDETRFERGDTVGLAWRPEQFVALEADPDGIDAEDAAEFTAVVNS